MGKHYSLTSITPDKPPYLTFSTKEIDQYRQTIFEQYQRANGQKIVIVHAGSGGSAINISIKQYAELITLLSENESLFFILTAGPGEEETAQKLSSLIETGKHAVYCSTRGLKEFSKLLSIATLFISGSTGVLHIAGALDIPTIAFYPARRSATSLRWRTLNSNNRHLAFSSDVEGSKPIQMDIIDCYQQIKTNYLHNNHG
jgi:ADP-heptose:LPS heptosyltransferase